MVTSMQHCPRNDEHQWEALVTNKQQPASLTSGQFLLLMLIFRHLSDEISSGAGVQMTNAFLEDIGLKDERELHVHPVSAPCQLRFEVSRDYWQLLNFLRFNVDERDWNALWYQRDLNHNVGDLVFMEDVEQFCSRLPGTALLFESINFILNCLEWLVIRYLIFCGWECS